MSKTPLGFSLIKLYNEQNHQSEKFEKINHENYLADYEIGVVKNKISNVINILYAICYCLGFAIGVYLIQNNSITIGDLTVYISSISIILSKIANRISPLLDGLAYYRQAKRRYNYFFNLETYHKEGKNLEEIETIEINHLTYCYGKKANPALQDISMKIKQGEKIGIVGQVGSGKTTLMNILAGFYEVPKNRVKINGIDIQEYSQEAIFQKIGYAMQKTVILDENIKNNIDLKQEKEESKIRNHHPKSRVIGRH